MLRLAIRCYFCEGSASSIKRRWGGPSEGGDRCRALVAVGCKARLWLLRSTLGGVSTRNLWTCSYPCAALSSSSMGNPISAPCRFIGHGSQPLGSPN